MLLSPLLIAPFLSVPAGPVKGASALLRASQFDAAARPRTPPGRPPPHAVEYSPALAELAAAPRGSCAAMAFVSLFTKASARAKASVT